MADKSGQTEKPTQRRLEKARNYREEWHRLRRIKRMTRRAYGPLDTRLPKRKQRARRPKSKYGEPFPED